MWYVVSYYKHLPMNSEEKEQLKKLLSQSDCDNNTEYIREFKNSERLLNDISVLEKLKRSHRTLRENSPDDFAELCRTECSFLYNGFTIIFNKLLKDEVHLGILIQMIRVLKQIEDGVIDQHEGSVIVGKILKEMYVDSAIRRGEHLDEEYAKKQQENVQEVKPIRWKDFKQMNV